MDVKRPDWIVLSTMLKNVPRSFECDGMVERLLNRTDVSPLDFDEVSRAIRDESDRRKLIRETENRRGGRRGRRG